MSARALDQLASEITILANLLRKSTASIHRVDGLPPGALQVLQLLRQNGDLTVPQIGRMRVTSRQNIQITVNRMREDGLVEVVTNPSHRRSVLVRATEKGASIVEAALHREDLNWKALSARIVEEDIVAAAEMLRRFREILNETEKTFPVPPQTTQPEKRPSRISAEAPAQFPSLADAEEIPVSLL